MLWIAFCKAKASSDSNGKLRNRLILWSSAEKAVPYARFTSSSEPSTAAGSGLPNAQSSADRAKWDKIL